MRNNDKAVVLPMAGWVRMPPCLGRDLEDVAMLAGVAERQSEPVGVRARRLGGFRPNSSIGRLEGSPSVAVEVCQLYR